MVVGTWNLSAHCSIIPLNQEARPSAESEDGGRRVRMGEDD